MPAADFCRPVRPDRSGLRPESETNGRSPEVSSTAFDAQPPDLQPGPLMDRDFAITCPLVRPRRPRIRFLFIGSRLGSTLLSDPASRRHPCASLSLHLHQVVKGTCTLKLSSMLGTQHKGLQVSPCSPGSSVDYLSYRLLRKRSARTISSPILPRTTAPGAGIGIWTSASMS